MVRFLNLYAKPEQSITDKIYCNFMVPRLKMCNVLWQWLSGLYIKCLHFTWLNEQCAPNMTSELQCRNNEAHCREGIAEKYLEKELRRVHKKNPESEHESGSASVIWKFLRCSFV